MISELAKGLVNLGLTEKEAIVYTSLLSLGEVGSSKIIKTANLHGQFVYQALASLEEKGLVRHVVQSGRKKFSANPPARIAALIHNKSLLAEALVPQLESLNGNYQQQFEVFQGPEAYVAHEFDQLEGAVPETTLGIIGGGEGPAQAPTKGDVFYSVMGSRMNEYERLREKKKIQIKYIGGENQRMNLFWYKNNRPLFEYKLLPGTMKGLINIDLWHDTVNFNMFGSPIVAISIRNEELAKSHWDFFDTLWKIARS